MWPIVASGPEFAVARRKHERELAPACQMTRSGVVVTGRISTVGSVDEFGDTDGRQRGLLVADGIDDAVEEGLNGSPRHSSRESVPRKWLSGSQWLLPLQGHARTRHRASHWNCALWPYEATPYIDRPRPRADGLSGLAMLKQVPVGGGGETMVLDGVRFGLWSVTNQGFVFVRVVSQYDELDFYDFHDRHHWLLARLPARLTGRWSWPIARLARRRWTLLSATGRSESDVMVAHGFR